MTDGGGFVGIFRACKWDRQSQLESRRVNAPTRSFFATGGEEIRAGGGGGGRDETKGSGSEDFKGKNEREGNV